MTTKRTYLDPIHQDIVLDRRQPAERLVMDLIDAREFQRLRRVHQLGVSFFTFQGAEGSRFTHSVGVMHVASQLINMLSEKTPSIEKHRGLILASALLHDIGHGPYSHVTEKILHYDHEEWSCKIISGDTQVREVLDKYTEYPNLAETIVKLLKKEHYPKYLSHIVSSQLDCDRFDYLLRDSYMTGTAYGHLALQRILRSLEINEEKDRIEVVGEKGQTAVEDYLFGRYSMYAQVYYHRKNLAARAHLAKLLRRVKQLMEANHNFAFMDDPTAKWLNGDKLTVDEYLSLDDVQMTYHIKRWVGDSDPVLKDLAARFLDRKLFKATRIMPPPGANNGNGKFKDSIEQVQNYARKIVKDAGFDPEYYVAVESTGFRPYDYYRPDAAIPQTNIVVRTDTGLVSELSELSPTIAALVKGDYESFWLVYPPEVSEKVLEIKELAHAR
ncbi:MAG: HD domain-containing protein [Leptolyngbya sp.]|nr:HD domain-containing protein [Candidatus Melainabacteria bacterium]